MRARFDNLVALLAIVAALASLIGLCNGLELTVAFLAVINRVEGDDRTIVMATNGTGGDGALINLPDLSKPATTLIERISDAVGGIAKPWQTVRVARAEAKAEVIRAQARIQVSEMEERALIRMIREEGKKQQNIENITAKAIPQLSSRANPQNIETDWLSHFFDRCRLVSDEEMQSLWANMLAGEANEPGSFSKRTIDRVATLDRSDAQLFTSFCTFVWTIAAGSFYPFIYDVRNEILNLAQINYPSLHHLDDVGLVDFDDKHNFLIPSLPKITRAYYYGTSINIEFPVEGDNTLSLGKAVLTHTG
jgi:hypothetical protein